MINIRTVASYGYENVIIDKYDSKMEKPYQYAIKKGIIAGVLFGLTQIIFFIILGLVYYFAAIIVRDNP